jgi:hypothetical protein
MPHRFVSSERLGADPALRWLRGVVIECFAGVLRESERLASQ